MKRAYYSKSIKEYILDPESSILGELTANHSNRTLEELQINAWRKQILILKKQLKVLKGKFILNLQFLEWENELIIL